MKILVTGGAGFLGSHLCEQLLGQDFEVICIDNLSTGHLQNIKNLLENKRFTFLEHDVSNPIQIGEIGGIFNLACPASPLAYQKYPLQTFRSSVLGAMNLLDIANRSKCTILQASTSEIYGDPLEVPQTETYWGNVNPIGIRACYDEGKRAAETLFVDSYREFATDIRIARIFNTYGPKMAQNDGRVVSNFIVQALLNQPLTIFGDGSQVRSFCYVDDLITGLIKLFHANSFFGPVNLGNPSSITVLELAREIISLTNSQSEIVFYELPSDDPQRREPEISRAVKELDWQPNISREEGLNRTIKYFRKLLI